MNDIEQKALQTFTKNLKYFEDNHKPIFEKLTLLNQLIDDGTYPEHYALEYKEEGYFDILELNTHEFLYKNNSIEAAKRMVNIIDLQRTGAVFKAQQYVFATDLQAEAIDQSELCFHNALWATIKIINYVSKYATPETQMHRVHKIIFLGMGLGLHLEGMIKKLNPQVIFIKESNLETFRLSLFVTNYAEILKNHFVYFSISQDATEERIPFLEFLNKGNNYNLNLKHIPFTLTYAPDLQRLQTHVLSQDFISYGYSAILLRYIDSPRYLVKGYSFLNINQNHQNHPNNVFSHKPVLLLFSGPSTTNNIEWIKANRDRFIVVSALSTCRLLCHHEITPDIVIHIDPGEGTALLFKGLDTKEYFKNTIAILSSNVNEDTISRFDRSKIHLVEQGTCYKKGFGRLSAPSVGEYTYALFLILGASRVFLLGIDLAVDRTTLKSHGEFHPSQGQGQIDTTSPSLDPSSSVAFTKGNFSPTIPTLTKFMLSIEQLQIFTKMLKKEYHHVYNLSDGAYLEGCEPLRLEAYDWSQLELLDAQETHQQVDDFLKQISSSDFNDDDKGVMKYHIKEARKLEKIIKQHSKKKFATTQAYLNALAQLSWDLSDMEYKTQSDLSQVYYEYFLIILSYIYDLFNTKELENPMKHMRQIDAILVKQLLKISQLYISKLEGYLK
ncbi:MAG: motility associated factor glycosyltransferase family protein [Campylobacteraceae bacterium]|nr:motility associated factor glycosyltransferase family protein [Campylobacteraceae bacterium]